MARVTLCGKDFAYSKDVDEEFVRKLLQDLINIKKEPIVTEVIEKVADRFNPTVKKRLTTFELEKEFKDRKKGQRFSKRQIKLLKKFVLSYPFTDYSGIAEIIGTDKSYVSRILIAHGVRKKTQRKDKKVKVAKNNCEEFVPAEGIKGINHPEFRKPEYLRKVIFSQQVPNIFSFPEVKEIIFGNTTIKGMGRPTSPYYKGYSAFNNAYSNLIKKLLKEGKIKFVETTAYKRVKVYAKLPNTENINFIEVKGSRVDPFATYNGLQDCLNKGYMEWKEDAHMFGFDTMGKTPQNEWVVFLCSVAKCIKELDPKAKAKLNLNLSRLYFEK